MTIAQQHRAPSQASPPPPPQKQPNRMTIASVTRGLVASPFRAVLYGTEGVGKTTWAAASEAPIFIPSEDGTNCLDVARFPRPETWDDVTDAVKTLTQDKHDFRTIVLDTIDAIEPLCWAKLCQRHGKPDIEAFGYGKGYTAALDEWRVLLAAIERLVRACNMNVILIGHAQIKTFKNPTGPDYDRYSLKINERAGGLIREWSDATLFATYEEFGVKDPGNERRVRGVSSGSRIIHTQRRAAWDAKNRYDLPEFMPLSFEDFAAGLAAHRPADPEKLREEIVALLLQLKDTVLTKKVEEAVKDAGDDAARLARMKDRLAAKAAQSGE